MLISVVMYKSFSRRHCLKVRINGEENKLQDSFNSISEEDCLVRSDRRFDDRDYFFRALVDEKKIGRNKERILVFISSVKHIGVRSRD